MGYFRVHFKADYFLFSQVVDFSAVKVPKSLRGRRLTIPSFELLLLVFSALMRGMTSHGFVEMDAQAFSFVPPSPPPPPQKNRTN